MISKKSGAEIRYYANPRKEDKENELRLSCQNFLELGLNPTTLDEGLVSEIYDIAGKYKERCDQSKIICTSVWNKDIMVDKVGCKDPVECNNKFKN
jgi:UDP-sulfoquinovose synthase